MSLRKREPSLVPVPLRIGPLLLGLWMVCGLMGGSSRAALRLVIDGEPAHLNPLLDPDLWGHRIVHDLICEPLLRRVEGASGPTYEGVLAERFRLDRDGRGLDLWLRKGVHFHDGRPLSAYDVQLSLQMVLASEHSAPQPKG